MKKGCLAIFMYTIVQDPWWKKFSYYKIFLWICHI